MEREMGLEVEKDIRILTCNMKDEECFHGWDKETIHYLQKNEDSIKKYLYRYLRKKRADSVVDPDDLIGELYMALYTGRDYELEKAIKEDGEIIPVEGYVKAWGGFVALKAISKAFSSEKGISRPKRIGEEEYSPLDSVKDGTSVEQMDNIAYDLEDICEMCEPHRNRYGVDIYTLFYVRLMIGNESGSEEKYVRALEGLGIRKRDIEEFQESSRRDDHVLSIAKAVNKCGERSLSIIERYVYAADRIKNLVASL